MTSAPATREGPVPRFLEDLQEESRRQLLRGAERCRHAAGEKLDDREAPTVGLLFAGIARTYLLGPDGRQHTVRYLRSGDLFGTERLFGATTDIRAEAVTPVQWARLLPSRVATLMRVDSDVALAVAQELAADHAAAVEQVWQSTFATLSERLAHHLMLRAEIDQSELRLTHKEMAAMVGSVREVVGRLAKQMERAGAVRRLARGAIEIEIDALRPFLHQLRQPQDQPEAIPQSK